MIHQAWVCHKYCPIELTAQNVFVFICSNRMELQSTAR
jgi:hypothetical protein